ncbi:hypothetical protein [Dyadobacter sp. Leaf189]|uniref:hypothetical protein n=1 Tax=Dyadobacter sp. Leaf189 TaxID=1736295 RepID=UPI0006FEA7B3|nr:hypothetical protein [Dyadobacter sp. Leaf189]KQS26859.1 hypothetical protein ASG33_20155 [Dyadobacter sp. Leaf189]
MKLCIIVILTAFIASSSFSQVPLILRPCEQQQKLPFDTVEIIDNRDEKQILGFVQVGIGNVTRLVTFDGILADTLAKFFPPTSVSSSNPKSLVILLNQLYMDENTDYTETGLLKISKCVFFRIAFQANSLKFGRWIRVLKQKDLM